MKRASERLGALHGVCKILVAGWPPPIPDLPEDQRQSRKRFTGLTAGGHELGGVRNQAHVLARRARAILPDHLIVFEVADARPVGGMNSFPEVSSSGGLARSVNPLLPRSNEADGIWRLQFFQGRAPRPIAEERHGHPDDGSGNDHPEQYGGAH